MNKLQIAARNKSINAALGSVRAEGLKPSIATQKQLRRYAEGKITSKVLRSTVIGKIKVKAKTAR